MTMFIRNYILLISILLSAQLFGQISYTGIASDNVFSGGNAFADPSSIVNSTTKFSFASSLSTSTLSNFYARRFMIYGIYGRYVKHHRSGYNKHFQVFDIANLKIELGHDRAVAYSLRFRIFENFTGIQSTWAQATTTGYNEISSLTPFDLNGYNWSKMQFSEHAFTYGQTIFNKSTRYLKAGATLKILNGLNADYVGFTGGTGNFFTASWPTMQVTNASAEFGSNSTFNQSSYKNFGLGLDIGATYEFRPEIESHFYDMDGETHIERFDRVKYKLKVFASLTDLGAIRYFKDTTHKDFTNSTSTVNANEILDLSGINLLSPATSIKSFLQTSAATQTQSSPSFRMNLPATLHFGGDYHWTGPFFIGYHAAVPLNFSRDASSFKSYFIHTITPRIEHTNWGIQLPISQWGNGRLSLGLSGRFMFHGWSVILGTANASILYGKKSSLSRSFFLGVAFQIPHTIPKDRDNDKISDLKDNCPDDFGLSIHSGCPDTDGDGIIDRIDHCIYDKGPKTTNGCPDTDGDGILDLNDMCPQDAGLAIHYGCPDKDKDGVLDAADRCPDVPGIELNNGCPFELKSCCEDADGDGVMNMEDKCPKVSGSVYNQGCPVDSTNLNKIQLNDKKTILDPNHADTQLKDSILKEMKANLITNQQDLKKLSVNKNVALDYVVYFDVDQSTLRQPDGEAFTEEFKRLIQAENISFILIGYTDRDGSLDYNLILSKKRAETVKRKLIDLGFKEDSIALYYYGETKSLHKGSYTKEMKQEDRKVEIKVIQN
jgi:outer membrane protein OmpA-like peptidoglycan-associated protein